MTDYFKPGERPYCVYTESEACFRIATAEEKICRFDGAGFLHTCPQGMALDRACDAMAEACIKNRIAWVDPPKPPENPGYGGIYPGWPFF